MERLWIILFVQKVSYCFSSQTQITKGMGSFVGRRLGIICGLSMLVGGCEEKNVEQIL